MNNDDRLNQDALERERLAASQREVREGEAHLTLSEEELALGKREVRAGEVDIRKRVETEHVRENVQLAHDEVVVERRPITGAEGLNAAARITGEEEIHVPLTREEVVAEKRVVPKEELVVRKREVVENEVVDADLRRERAEVIREGDTEIRKDLRADGLDRNDRI